MKRLTMAVDVAILLGGMVLLLPLAAAIMLANWWREWRAPR